MGLIKLSRNGISIPPNLLGSVLLGKTKPSVRERAFSRRNFPWEELNTVDALLAAQLLALLRLTPQRRQQITARYSKLSLVKTMYSDHFVDDCKCKWSPCHCAYKKSLINSLIPTLEYLNSEWNIKPALIQSLESIVDEPFSNFPV